MIFDDDLKHDEVHTQRRARAHPVHGEYAARKLELNAAAIKMAARALTQQEGLRTWVWRWRRLVKLKRLGKAAARRMRQRYMLRGIRRMLAGWQAVGASAAGSRRIVAERVATMNHRRRFTHTLHAWRDVKEEGKERKRAVAKAAQRFRAVWMRSGREALSRWRENTQAKKIIIAATEIAAAGGGNTLTNLQLGPMQATFLGYPVVISQVLPGTGNLNNQAMLMFGVLGDAAKMGDRRGTRIKVDDSKYLDTDETAVQGTTRWDINVHDIGDATTAGPVVALIGNT